MRHIDLVLLHAPSVYDFRETSIMFGPISDLVPSTPIFEMYPIGFVALSEYLERCGFSVRIVNIAVMMIKDPNLNVEKLIASLNPRAFGIDLHWLPHAHGSLEIAGIVKKYHPDTPVIFGGYSSTYYEKELITYPQVDYVLKGDSTELPLKELLECIKKDTEPSSVPNITWKNKKGEIQSNPISYVPDNIDGISLDCTHIMRSVIRHQDLMGHVPFENWLDYPITPVLSCRGCKYCCATCGGSAYGGKKYLNRRKPAFRDPQMLAEDIGKAQQYLKSPVFIFGDIRQAGDDYADKFLDELRKKRITSPVVFEFFTPPPKEFYEKLHWAVPHYNIEISPESHDEEIRFAFGRPFSNEDMESSIKYALENGCERVDLFFMSGLPKQTPHSVLETEDYADYLLDKFNSDQRVHLFVSPLGPFLDPGSLVFENPENFGYKIIHKTLEEHRQALTQPSWKHLLNYETEWMSREEHVECIYDTALALNRIKAKHGVISDEVMIKEEAQVIEARKFMHEIERVAASPDEAYRNTKLEELRLEANKHANAPGSQIKELEWRTNIFSINVPRVLHTLLFENTNSRVSVFSLLGLMLKISLIQGGRLLRQVLPSRS